MERISLSNINKRYEDNIIIEDFSIEIELNKVNCILGKSGCGKTTLLNILSGLIPNDTEGFESLDKFGISYVFQEDRLINWLSVEGNLKLVCNNKKGYFSSEKCKEYLNIVGMEGYENYFPEKLSGGLRQRVNIARAILYPSKFIIMDEPFKSIDIKNKELIIKNLKEIFRKENKTVIFVTHDIDEAIDLADNIYVLGNRPLEIKKVFENRKKWDRNEISMLI